MLCPDVIFLDRAVVCRLYFLFSHLYYEIVNREKISCWVFSKNNHLRSTEPKKEFKNMFVQMYVFAIVRTKASAKTTGMIFV